MFPIPYRKVHIVSPHPADMLAERLRLRTSPRQRWFRAMDGQFDFVGSVSPSDFRLVPTIRGRNTYLPWLLGRMTPRPDGTEIQVVQTLHPIAIAAMLAFLIVWVVVVVRAEDYRSAAIFIAGLFVFHCVMYLIGFLPEARRAEERIRQLAA